MQMIYNFPIIIVVLKLYKSVNTWSVFSNHKHVIYLAMEKRVQAEVYFVQLVWGSGIGVNIDIFIFV